MHLNFFKKLLRILSKYKWLSTLTVGIWEVINEKESTIFAACWSHGF